MVSAIHIITIGLGAAFVLGLLRDEWRARAYGLTLAALAAMSAIAAGWLWAFTVEGAPGRFIETAGSPPPFAINLRIDLPEAALLALICLTGLASAVYLTDTLMRLGRRAMAVLLITVMALSGIVLTRDLFNMFVFFELAVISTGGLILLSAETRALGAGIKYLIVAQAISILLLVGIIFSYHLTGTLNIDGMAGASEAFVKGGMLAFFLVLMALVLELKPFPANGWALDIYEAAHPAFSAIFSAASGSAAIYALDKVLPAGGAPWLPVVSAIGIITFIASNVLALSQTDDRRLLGYSSVAQIGLILTVIGLRDLLGERYLFVAGGILVAHAVAKDMENLRDFTLDAITSLPDVGRVETSLVFRATHKPVWPDLTRP